MSVLETLEDIPDLTDPDAPIWVEQQIERAKALVPTETANVRTIDGSEFVDCSGPLGCYGSRAWRAFTLAILVADWVCYPLLADRVDFVRLMFVLDRFPQGFRLWLMRDEWGFVPIGYTGWFPIEETVFQRIASGRPPLVDRALVPLRASSPGGYRYLFNYSLAPGLKSYRAPSGERLGAASPIASSMMQRYAQDVQATAPAGLTAITVSGDGSRVAERFGMRATGELEVDGAIEFTYATP